MGSPVTLSHLTLGDLERSISRSFRFRNLISRKGSELGHMLLLNINRKAYMGSQMTLSHLTLSDLKLRVCPESGPENMVYLIYLLPISYTTHNNSSGIYHKINFEVEGEWREEGTGGC